MIFACIHACFLPNYYALSFVYVVPATASDDGLIFKVLITSNPGIIRMVDFWNVRHSQWRQCLLI